MAGEVRWWPGRSHKVPAEVLVDTVRRLAEEHGVCQPAMLVEEARPQSSPLHEAFDWDPETCTERDLRRQARELIGSVRVTFHEQERAAPAFMSVKMTGSDGEMQQGYVDTIRALSSEQMRKQVIADALRQLKGWQRRYRMIVELSRVAEAIDGALDEHDPDDR